VSTAVTWRG